MSQNTEVTQIKHSQEEIASQEAFDKFAGVNGNAEPVDQEYIEIDRAKIEPAPPIAAKKGGRVALAHMLENSLNSNRMRNSKDYQDRQRKEKDSGRLLPY